MFRARIAAPIIALAASAALLAGAGAASASPRTLPLKVTAVTFVQDRPDGGNGSPDPYWANDTMLRELVITQTGGVAGAYTFTATLTDRGSFTTIKGKQAPNQGAPYTGEVIKSRVTGRMDGYADFSFTASTLPDGSLVPGYEDDHGAVPSDSTSTWYELAFPADTTFTGPGIGDWSWAYHATVRTVTFRTFCLTSHFCWTFPVVHVSHQRWVDALDNGYGDVAPADGQITG